MAGNVVDTMVLVLGLDASKFTQQQKDALDTLKKFQEEAVTQGKRVESQANQTYHTMSAFKREVLGTLALFAGGAGGMAMLNFISNLDASTGRLSKQLNVNTRELSAWQGVMTQVGGTAEDANTALGALSTSMNQFFLGMGANPQLMGVLNQLKIPLAIGGKQRTADEVMKDLSRGVQGMDPGRASALLGGIPGMNQSMLNALLEGPEALERRLGKARALGGTGPDDAKRAQEFQTSVALFDRAVTQFNRVIGSILLPVLTKILEFMTEGTSSLTDTPEQRKAREQKRLDERGGVTTTDEMRERLGKPPLWAERLGSWLSGGTPDGRGQEQRFRPAPAAGPRPVVQGSGFPGATERESYIRAAAKARGIDPDTAVAVARSEGLGGAYVGDRGSSFGDFQLHYGGMAGGGMAVKGLGDEFTKKTGLDARDSSTWKSQVDFSLDTARAKGWRDWHGWRGAAFAGIGEGGGGTNVTIGTIQINAPHAKDAAGIATEIAPQLRRAIEAGSMNQGAI